MSGRRREGQMLVEQGSRKGELTRAFLCAAAGESVMMLARAIVML
jgi:hypothetical protein